MIKPDIYSNGWNHSTVNITCWTQCLSVTYRNPPKDAVYFPQIKKISSFSFVGKIINTWEKNWKMPVCGLLFLPQPQTLDLLVWKDHIRTWHTDVERKLNILQMTLTLVPHWSGSVKISCDVLLTCHVSPYRYDRGYCMWL